MSENEHAELIRDEDRDFFECELTSFVPDRVFDAHCHLWHPDHREMDIPDVPRIAGAQEYRSLMEALCPGRRIADCDSRRWPSGRPWAGPQCGGL